MSARLLASLLARQAAVLQISSARTQRKQASNSSLRIYAADIGGIFCDLNGCVQIKPLICGKYILGDGK